ncbi:MAG: carboxypeptidase regulatory-like domain-containing protein [Acidobacteria bacterium]|nr:carboxypeptidase regulatory-like domain-containing protein [Acidobacteriota bacterium]
MTVTDGATMRGRLVQNGKPVAGAQVGLVPRQRGMGAELKLHGDPYDEIRIGTQLDGTFVFANVPAPVEWYIYGKMESIAERGATGAIECITKKDGEDVSVGDIHINTGHRLRGKVVLSDGKPIPDGMRVSISTDQGFDTQTVPLNQNGSFEFLGLAPGKYEVFASVRGYRAPAWDYRSRTDPPSTVKIEQDLENFVLSLDPVK